MSIPGTPGPPDPPIHAGSVQASGAEWAHLGTNIPAQSNFFGLRSAPGSAPPRISAPERIGNVPPRIAYRLGDCGDRA